MDPLKYNSLTFIDGPTKSYGFNAQLIRTLNCVYSHKTVTITLLWKKLYAITGTSYVLHMLKKFKNHKSLMLTPQGDFQCHFTCK